MKYIELTRGKQAIVDDDDFEWLSEFKWNYHETNGVGYAEGWDASIGKVVKMHRMIMGFPTEGEVDHINGDKIDNRRSNLRVVTHQQNCQARRRAPKHMLGYRGVGYAESVSNPYRARIMVDGRRIHLGVAPTPEAAYELYRQAAHKYFGEFAGV